MAIKRENRNHASAGILNGLKSKKEDVNVMINDPVEVDVEAVLIDSTKITGNTTTSENEETSKMINNDNQESIISVVEVDVSNNDKSLMQQAKDLIKENEEPVRRTFTIETLTHTQLNELKVFVMPAVTGVKKWGYNEILNMAINEFYEKQIELLKNKLKK